MHDFSYQGNELYCEAKVDFPALRDPLLREALVTYGIPLAHRGPRQFVPDPALNIVLGMGDQNKRIVEGKYAETELSPLIDTYHGFSGMPQPITPIIMQSDPVKYREFARYLKEATPRMVERALEYATR